MHANHLVSLVRIGTRLLTAVVGVLGDCDSDDGSMPEVTGCPILRIPSVLRRLTNSPRLDFERD